MINRAVVLATRPNGEGQEFRKNDSSSGQIAPSAHFSRTMIETPRLLLRDWRDEDLAPFSRMNADERVCEFLGKTFTREETRAMVERNRADFQEQGFGLWALEVKVAPRSSAIPD
jgi:RimJ/RimL family protein N-acetyltransferase